MEFLAVLIATRFKVFGIFGCSDCNRVHIYGVLAVLIATKFKLMEFWLF